MRDLITFLVVCTLFKFINAFVVGPITSPSHNDRATSSHLFQTNNNEDLTSVSASVTSRRGAIQQTVSGILLSSFLLQPDRFLSAKPAFAAEPKSILLTGGNSGVGYEATKNLAAQGHKIYLPCRTLEKSLDAIKRIESELANEGAAVTPGSIIAGECDLANLKSIDDYVKTLSDSEKFDVVCLNAGLSRNQNAKDVLRTADGFELTVGTNHFGHFYLNHLLLPKVNANGKIVVTASSVHDPESSGGAVGEAATLGNLEGLERNGRDCEMIDGNEFNADKAYKDSKLCNVLFTRELQRRLPKGITANAFTPGLIVTTGFFRDQSPIFTKLFDFATSNLFKVAETPEWGGAALTYMTSVEDKSGGHFYSAPPGSVKYGNDAFGNQFTINEPSKEAQDDEKAKRFWELSEKLVGIST